MRRLVVGLVAAAAMHWTAPSHATEEQADAPEARATEIPETKTAFSFALLGAFGAGGQYEDSTLNRYGVGFGARAGATLASPRLYLGLSFLRFLGDEDASGQFYTTTLDADIGYDIRVYRELLVVRPQVSVGVAQAVTLQSDVAGYPLAPHVAPGILVDLRLSPVSISLGLRRDTVTDEWSNAVSFMLGVGAVL